MPTLNFEVKQMLLSASAGALKILQAQPDSMELYVNVHKVCNRALPHQMIDYYNSILVHKLYNEKIPEIDWFD